EESPALRRLDTPAQSVFFFLRVRIMHRHHSSFADAQGRSGWAPRSASLVRIPCFMQDLSNRVAADVRQPIPAQGPLQRGKRPGAGLIFLPIRGALHFLHNSLPLSRRVGRFASPPGGKQQHCQSSLIEPLDELCRCLPTHCCLFACLSEGGSSGNGEQGFRASHHIHSFTRCFHDPLESVLLCFG